MDTLRNCYASWMSTPDAGRIRVRWYKVPVDPGVFDSSDYGSSNWDDDPKSLDPPLGEESSTRSPFNDYRDCCPPPWPEPDLDACPVALGPQWSNYRVPAVTWGVGRIPPTRQAVAVMPNTDPCVWSVDTGLVHPFVTTYRLVFNADGTASLSGIIRDGHTPLNLMVWRSEEPVDPHGPFYVTPFPPTTPNYVGPDRIRITGFSDPWLLVQSCTGLLVGPGLFLKV